MYSILDNENIMDYAGPLLIYCWEDRYLTSDQRILFIGQETNGWYCDYLIDENELNNCITDYKNFELGKTYNSPFWQDIYYINKKFNDKKELNFLWNNINKFGRADGSGRPDPLVTKIENEKLNIFKEELQIIDPEVCVFFTGPNYDDDIKNKLNDATFEKCSSEELRVLAKVKSEYLPEKTYRTYHPKYLRLSTCEYLLDTIIDLIEKK